MFLEDIFGNFFHYVHVSVIHFPLVTLSFATIFGGLAFILVFFKQIAILADKANEESLSKYLHFLENVTVFNLLFGVLSIPFVALMGFIDAKSLELAVTTDMLAFKIQLTTIAFVILSIPLVYKLYLIKKTDYKLFQNSVVIPFFYLLPVVVGTFLILLVAGAGGRYVFGHSLFDNMGLGFLIPQTFDYTIYYTHYNISFIAQKLTDPIGVFLTFIVLLALILYPFLRKNSSKSSI